MYHVRMLLQSNDNHEQLIASLASKLNAEVPEYLHPRLETVMRIHISRYMIYMPLAKIKVFEQHFLHTFYKNDHLTTTLVLMKCMDHSLIQQVETPVFDYIWQKYLNCGRQLPFLIHNRISEARLLTIPVSCWYVLQSDYELMAQDTPRISKRRKCVSAYIMSGLAKALATPILHPNVAFTLKPGIPCHYPEGDKRALYDASKVDETWLKQMPRQSLIWSKDPNADLEMSADIEFRQLERDIETKFDD